MSRSTTHTAGDGYRCDTRREATGMSGNEYVAELRAEVERLRAVVARVEGLAAAWIRDAQARGVADDLHFAGVMVSEALCASSPSVEHRYTQTDGQASAGRHEGAQGAGDGV